MKKLEMYGCSDVLLHWFYSYLLNRSLNVVLNNCTPGFDLGPLLFNIFINDLPLHLSKCMVKVYADDMTISVHGKSIDDVQLALNYESSILMDWFDQNKLVVNTQKSFSMLLCTYQRR